MIGKGIKGKAAVERTNVVLERLSVEYVPIDSIKPNPYNPNRQGEHEFAMLRRSMEEDGFTQPVIVDRSSMEIVDGEHRWRMGSQLGYTDIPVVFVDMDEAQRRISTMRHNKARGTHDVELDAELLRDLQRLGSADWAQDALGLTDLEMQRLVDDVDVTEALASDEYAEAWAPDKMREADSPDIAMTHTSPTAAATETLRRREEALKAARTAEERARARKDNDVYRVTLIFSGDEAKVVRKVLADHPAGVILALCQTAVECPPPPDEGAQA